MNRTVENAKRSEYDLQCQCVNYLDELAREQEVTYTATAQSTYTNSWSVITRNKKSGVRRGLPDLIIIVNKKLIFIELKNGKGGKLSPEQKNFIEKLKEAGANAFVCWSFEDFVGVVNMFV